jgi:hypothetical protein
MNFLKRPNLSLIALVTFAGGAGTVTPACGSGTISSGTGASGSGASSSLGNVGGAPATGTDCPAGNERCACYGNGTCNTGLVCASQHCVNANGVTTGSTGGSSTGGIGGATGNNGGTQMGSLATGGFSSNGSTGGTSAGDTSEIGGSVATGGTLATGGSAATGGALATGGSVATGGARATGGAVATGGASATGGVSFWKTVTYSSTGLPNPSDGNHNAGKNCMQCHASGSSSDAPTWLFGGTVYKADGTTPAPNVQVGINDGTNLFTAYSATNGNIWFGGSGTINWAQAQVRIRNSNGELTMAGATPAATCNTCHNATTYPRITAP